MHRPWGSLLAVERSDVSRYFIGIHKRGLGACRLPIDNPNDDCSVTYRGVYISLVRVRIEWLLGYEDH